MVVIETLYPFESHFFQMGHLKLHYLDEGVGNPVLMIHGNPTWSFYYRNLVSALKPNARCIVPDHIGCGYSDKPTDADYRYTLQQRVDDIIALLKHLEVTENITLIAHDWGGMIGMAIATQYPEWFNKIVLFNTAAFHLPEGKKVPIALRLVRDTFIGSIAVRGFNAFSRGAAWVGCTRQRMSRELRAAYCSPYNSWGNRIATLRFVQDIPLQPSDPAYATISRTQEQLHVLADKPMLLIWGAKDFVFDLDYLAVFKTYFPEATVHQIDDAGHYVLEDAAEEIIPLVQEFLSS